MFSKSTFLFWENVAGNAFTPVTFFFVCLVCVSFHKTPPQHRPSSQHCTQKRSPVRHDAAALQPFPFPQRNAAAAREFPQRNTGLEVPASISENTVAPRLRPSADLCMRARVAATVGVLHCYWNIVGKQNAP